MKEAEIRNSQCLLCGALNLNRLRTKIERNGHIFSIYECTRCGFAVTEPLPNRDELLQLYSSDIYRAHERRFVRIVEFFIRHFRIARLRRIKNFCSRGRILDIGCGRGLILWMAKKEGWETYGLEFNDDTAFHAQNVLGMDIRTGSIRDVGFEHGTFDVITIWHALEHMEDPVSTIGECYKLLKPGGVLALSVPNSESLQARIAGKYWFHLEIPYHFYHFSGKNMTMLLKKSSFRIEQVKHFSFEQNPFGFLQSLLNISGIRNNLLYDILKSGNLKVKLRTVMDFRDLFFTVILLFFLAPLALILSAVESFLGRGGTIEVYATKIKK